MLSLTGSLSQCRWWGNALHDQSQRFQTALVAFALVDDAELYVLFKECEPERFLLSAVSIPWLCDAAIPTKSWSHRCNWIITSVQGFLYNLVPEVKKKHLDLPFTGCNLDKRSALCTAWDGLRKKLNLFLVLTLGWPGTVWKKNCDGPGRSGVPFGTAWSSRSCTDLAACLVF